MGSNYVGGASYPEVESLLKGFGFRYVFSTAFKNVAPFHVDGCSEFDALFVADR